MAGYSPKLAPHTFNKSKALFEVAGKPILSHVLDRVKGLDFSEVIFVLDEHNPKLEKYLKSKYKFKFSFVLQKERRGVADAIHQARGEFEKDEDVFILFVDTLIEADFKDFKKGFHDGIIWTKKVDDPRRFGVVFHHENYISKLIEKPAVIDSNEAMVGMYYFRSWKVLHKAIKHIIDNDILNQGEYQLTDAMQIMINNGAKLLSREVKTWKDFGSLDSILEANSYLLKNNNIKSQTPTKCVIIKPVYIGEGCKITNSVIGPHVSIGRDCTIEGCIIRNSIVGEESRVTDANLNKSVIGAKNVVSARGKSLNLGDLSLIDM